MPGTPATANLTPGIEAPATGIYVVSHRSPAHALPHDVLIAVRTILPKCRVCTDVRFSLRMLATQPIEESEFFRYARILPKFSDGPR
jgi:hypothetical protein